jgi:hypothetical protein
MVDVVNQRCKKEGCESHPTFNVEGEKKGIYCGKCKEPNMVDVVNPRCKSDWCDTLLANMKDIVCHVL